MVRREAPTLDFRRWSAYFRLSVLRPTFALRATFGLTAYVGLSVLRPTFALTGYVGLSARSAYFRRWSAYFRQK